MKMKLFSVAVVGFVLLAFCCGFAGASGAVAPEKISELSSSLQSANGGKPTISFKKNGYVGFLGAPSGGWFPVTNASTKDLEEQAKAFLADWQEVLHARSIGFGWTTKRVKESSNRTYVHLGQTYRGLTVFGAETVVQLNGQGRVACVINDLMSDASMLDDGKLSLKPSLDERKAKSAAVACVLKEYGIAEAQADEPTLEVFDPSLLGLTGPLQLVWRVTVQSNNDIKESVLVNAHDASISLHYPLIYTAKSRQIYDSNNTTADPGVLVRSEGQGVCGIQDADLAYQYYGDTYDFYYAENGRDSIDNQGYTLSATVRFCKPAPTPCPYQNAYWNGTRMYFGQGFSAADDVVAHELSHGVTQNESNLIYYYQSGAINESLSDMWGEFIDLTNGSGTDTPETRWLMGEDVPGIGAIRDMQNPPAFSDPDRMGHPYYYTGSEDNGGVHTNSGVGNKLCYLLVDGDTFNGQTVTGMGISLVADIFYECQTNLLTSISDYYDLNNCISQACINLDLTASQRDNVRRACVAVGISPTPTSVTSLAEAVDKTDGTFITTGNASWFSQTATSYYGGDAAQSGVILDNQATSLEATVYFATAGTLSFYWKVSSEQNYDFLVFFFDSVPQASISGNANWALKSYPVPAGTHKLVWRYIKDVSLASGSDCGWVDKVVWSGTSVPTITPTDTPSNTPTFTYTNTPTITPTNTPSNTPTFTYTNTPTNTPTPTITPTNTPSNTPTFTYTNTPTNTPTPTITPTNTPSNTPTFTYTNTPTNTPTPTITPTNTPSNTPTFTYTNTPTITPSNTPTNTSTPTITPSNTPTRTNTPTFTPTDTPTATNTPSNTPTRTNTPSSTPTNTPTRTPTPTFTPNVPPQVVSISRYTPGGQLTNLQGVTWRVQFSERVSGLNAADFKLTRLYGVEGCYITAAPTPVTGWNNALWEVKANTGTGNGGLRLDVASTALIVDSAGANVSNIPYSSGQTYLIDKTKPTITSTVRQSPSGELTTSQAVVWRLTFIEAVSGLNAYDFVITRVSGAISGYYIPVAPTVVVGSNQMQWDVKVNTGTGDGVLRLDVSSGAIIRDVAMNNVGNIPYTSGQSYKIDKTRPTILSIKRQSPLTQITGVQNVVWRLTFSEWVSGLNVSDFFITQLGAITNCQILIPPAAVPSSAQTQWDVTVNTGFDDGTIRLDVPVSATIVDQMNYNVSNIPYTSGETYFIDKP